MANLFEESDFALFTKYQGKTQKEEPTGMAELKPLYNKLGSIIEGLQKLGYPIEIRKMPLTQGGPGIMKYNSYHWSKVYPKDNDLYNECNGKVFVVVGSTEGGIDIHIDSNSRKGYNSDENKEARIIKNATWLQISPSDAAQLSLEQLVEKVDSYFSEYWTEFNKFAKEFGVQESIKILQRMELEKIAKLVKANHNVILTGAPGTGKTYLAKKIAKAMGADDNTIKMVQFHPSYDYTDFVEGLRPIGAEEKLGFQRKNGVFKDFCKDAIIGACTNSVTALEHFKKVVGKEFFNIPYKSSPNKEAFAVKVDENNKLRVRITDDNDNLQAATDEDVIESIMTGNRVGNKTYAFSIGAYIKEHIMTKQTYVFIIDEINRGEISKIFGELFYAVDPGYRGKKGCVTTQYHNLVPKDDVFANGFYIPENVYIIGTMNDIDRSVESMDFAMRRRFAWTEITAESRQSMLDEDEAWGDFGKPSLEVIREIKTRMNNLNACIIDKYEEEKLTAKEKTYLTKAYQIGASYFLKYAMYNDFDELWDNHIKGLLYEYLRGSTNIDVKMARLRKAYNDTTQH